jgi:Ni/Co efflux regulator RcnB
MNRMITTFMVYAMLGSAAVAGNGFRPSDRATGRDQAASQERQRGPGVPVQQPRQPDREQNRNFDRNDNRRDYDRRDDGRRFDNRNQNDRYNGGRDNRYYSYPRFRGGYYQPPRGYYSHRWIRGERLPPSYYASGYYVDDYWNFRLYAPPRGYRWVRVDNDVLLVAIATGIVFDALYNLNW